VTRIALIVCLLTAIAVSATPANAAFPGANGKLAFSSDRDGNRELYVANPDGSAVTRLTNSALGDSDPTWSPDGEQIASTCADFFLICIMNADGSGSHDIVENGEGEVASPTWSPDGTKLALAYYRMNACPDPSEPDFCVWQPDLAGVNADGSGFHDLTFSDDREEFDPAWSPGGTKIAFTTGVEGDGLRTMNADGTGVTSLGLTGERPDWSPDGTKLVYQKAIPFVSGTEIMVANADGTGETRLTNNTISDGGPVWSPDGAKIAFVIREGNTDPEIATMNADGTNRQVITNNTAFDSVPDWQPLPAAGYARPRGASPLYVSLVPAYAACTAPNVAHGAPLAFPACAPPSQSSAELTLGTPDANGQPVRSNAVAIMRAKAGNGATPADEADVRLQVSVTDVRAAGDLSDYTGALEARPVLRITDRLNTPHPGGPGPGTVVDTPFPFSVPCSSTDDPNVGSTCAANTTADAVLGGSVVEERRTLWQLDRFVVRDGAGAVFLTQGLFIP
jgi:hypothetical protein